jgi:sugar/nucleoside kinase (ribokinase family)
LKSSNIYNQLLLGRRNYYICRHCTLFFRFQTKPTRSAKGEEGVDIYSKNKVESTGIYKTKIVDPTGVGDTFAAVTSMGLTAGLIPINAAKLGAAAASIVVKADGPKNIKSLNKTYSR